MATFKANGLQFLVRGALDGTTRNPSFSVDPSSPFYREPNGETNMYEFGVENLGVIDLSLIPVVPSIGIRFVTSLWIYGIEPSPGATVDLIDSVSEKVMRNIAVGSPLDNFLFLNGTIRVPQGASLRLQGWSVAGDPSANLRVRLEVRPATSLRQLTAQLIASCCQNAPSQLFVPDSRPGPNGGDNRDLPPPNGQ